MGEFKGLCFLAAGALLTLSAAASGQDAKDAADVTNASKGSSATATKTKTVEGGTVVTETTVVEVTETFPAPTLGKKDTWVVGADRVAGYGWSKQIADGFPKVSGSNFNVFGKTTTAIEGAVLSGATIPLEGPRLTLDAFPIDHLSFGGTLMFNFENVTDGNSATGDESATAFGIEFRVGYELELSELIAFWPKVGIQWGYALIGDSDKRATNLDLHFDVPFIFMINSQAGLTVTPGVALPLLAQTKNIIDDPATNGSFIDAPKFLQVYAALGLITWF